MARADFCHVDAEVNNSTPKSATIRFAHARKFNGEQIIKSRHSNGAFHEPTGTQQTTVHDGT